MSDPPIVVGIDPGLTGDDQSVAYVQMREDNNREIVASMSVPAHMIMKPRIFLHCVDRMTPALERARREIEALGRAVAERITNAFLKFIPESIRRYSFPVWEYDERPTLRHQRRVLNRSKITRARRPRFDRRSGRLRKMTVEERWKRTQRRIRRHGVYP